MIFDLKLICKVYIYVTFLFATISFKNKVNYILVYFVLMLAILNESISFVFKSYGVSVSFSTNLYVIFNSLIWFLIIHRVSLRKQLLVIVMVVYLPFSLSFLFLMKWDNFNSYNFIMGALLYVVIFLYESFSELQRENFRFFLSNNYILFFCPVIYFIGFSFLFGFDKKIDNVTIFNNIVLYDFISFFSNIIYYTLINIYIYREKKLSNAG